MKMIVSDALSVQSSRVYNEDVNDIMKVNAHSKSFDFLRGEPELYNVSDLKKKYTAHSRLKTYAHKNRHKIKKYSTQIPRV